MSSLYSTFYAYEIPELARAFLENQQHTILIAAAVVALLNCFFGYHLRKVWGVLAGILIGFFLSAGICIYLDKTGTILFLASSLGAFTLGLLAFLLYRVGLFFICVLMVPMFLSRLFPVHRTETVLFWVLLGLITGILTLVWEREIISTVTAVGGGFAAAKCLILLEEHNSLLTLFLVGMVLSLTGIMLQFQPWRSRSSWNSDEERARDKHRHRRRMKRLKKKQRSQMRQEQKNGIHTVVPRPAQKKISTEYTPYSTRELYRRTADISAPLHQEFSDASSKNPGTETDSAPRMTAVGPDLSEVRQAISQEVSDIYQEQQAQMDAALNQLLEQEYLNTTKNLKKH
ncbi:MAG: hypothetical protein Q4B85_02280 [Lachnospiraceae bacterium]|nr:hypothetical protein [Lachnospiraceae bacterium]